MPSILRGKKSERNPRFVLLMNNSKESKKTLDLVKNYTEVKIETYFANDMDRRLPALLTGDGNFYGYKMIETYLNSVKRS